MKRIRKVVALLLVLVFSFTSVFAAVPGPGKNEGQGNSGKKKTNRFIVKYKTDKSSNKPSIQMKGNFKSSQRLMGKNHEVIETEKNMTLDEMLTELKKEGLANDIEYVQEDSIIEVFSNDSYFGEQWGLQDNTVTDEVYGNTIEVNSGVIQAWSTALGEGATVAVIDTGIDLNHEDIRNNIWINTGEIPADGIDQDGNGYIDDVNGWNFVNESNAVYDSSKSNAESHGTALAGIIAAEKDNGIGMAGVAPKAKILPLKVFENGQAYTSDILEAIAYAEEKGVKLVNCSWGTAENNQALKDAMADSDMLFVCAAGNNGRDLQQSPVYPACFGLDNIISVTAMNNSGSLSSFSNYSKALVDIAAPGEGIVCTIPGSQYGKKSGTSIAAAFVSGEAALVSSKYREAAVSEIRNRITGYSEKAEVLKDKVKDGSMAQCAKAVSNSGDGIIPVSDTVEDTVSGTVYSDNLGFSLLSMEEGYSAPQDVTASIFSLPAETKNGQMRMSVFGNTLTNMLGDIGDFEKDSNNDGWADGWTYRSSLNNGLSTDCVVGKHSQSIKANAITPINNRYYSYIKYQNNTPEEKPNTYYLVSGYVNIKNNENISPDSIIITPNQGDLFHDATTTKLKRADYSKLNCWQKIGATFKTLPSMSESNYVAIAYLTDSSTNAEFLVDGVSVYEITGEEYNTLSTDALLEKYNYVESTKNTIGKTIRSIGKNLVRNGNGERLTDYWEDITLSGGFNGEYFYKYNNIGYDGLQKIKVKPNTMYTVSAVGYTTGDTTSSKYLVVHVRDRKGNKTNSNAMKFNSIKSPSRLSISFTTTADDEEIWLFPVSDGLNTFYFKEVQLEEGTSASTYEPYYESSVVLTDNARLNSLPSGVKDEICISTGEYIKRIAEYTIKESDIAMLYTSGINVDLIRIKKSIFVGGFGSGSVKQWINIFGMKELVIAEGWDNAANIGMYSTGLSKDDLCIIVPKGSYSTLESVKSKFAGTKLIYKLAQPIVSEINTQPLTCYENGTIIIESTVKDTKNYNSGISIANTALPIKEIRSIYKVEGSNKTPVNLSSVNVAANRLSFTITDASKGDTYEYTYLYPGELSTTPTIRYSVPTDANSQSNSTIEAINQMQIKLNSLEQRVKALEDLIRSTLDDKSYKFQYDANGNLTIIEAQ